MLKLSNGRKVNFAVTVECPNDEFIELANDPDVQVAVAEEHGRQASIDEAMGLNVTAFTQMLVVRRGGFVEAMVAMDEEDLIRHIYSARAALKSMKDYARLADREWAKYRKGRRSKRDED